MTGHEFLQQIGKAVVRRARATNRRPAAQGRAQEQESFAFLTWLMRPSLVAGVLGFVQYLG
jgi:hypothetical protein